MKSLSRADCINESAFNTENTGGIKNDRRRNYHAAYAPAGARIRGSCRDIRRSCANSLQKYSAGLRAREEAAADSFIGLWRSRERLSEAASLKGYLIGIARNCALDKMRSVLKTAPPAAIDSDIDADLTDEIARRANIEIVRKAIAEMPPFEREIFVRRYYLYEPVKSIARHMGCNEKKEENTLHRYKEKLKSELIRGGINI